MQYGDKDFFVNDIFSDSLTFNIGILTDAGIDCRILIEKEIGRCDKFADIIADFAEDLAKASGAIKELWGCTKLNLGSFGDTNPHLHFHIVPKYEGGFEFGGAFAITNPEPVYLTDGEYQEMISALKAKLGI